MSGNCIRERSGAKLSCKQAYSWEGIPKSPFKSTVVVILAVYRYGNLVVDVPGGIANTEPVTADTMFVLMSSTKPLTASCLYVLKERGKIAWDDLVVDQCWSDG